MKMVALGDIVTIKGGGTPEKGNAAYWNGSVPWASVKDFKTTELTKTINSITEAGVAASATNIIPAGSIIVPTRMAVGKAAINAVPMAINQDLKALFVKANVDSRYLLHSILAGASALQRLATGATVKGITLDVLRALPIWLPALSEQKRIASILDQADGYRCDCKGALRTSDALDRAEFSAAFGDPRHNPMGWPKRALSELIEPIESGWSPNCLDRPATGDEWAVLKLGSVTYGRFDPSANKALPAEILPRKQIEVHPGDVLFSRKNTHDLVAASVLVTEKTERMMMPDLIFRLRPKDENVLASEFMQAAISFPTLRKHIQSLAGGAAGSMPNISKSKLNAVELIVPPIERQKAYSSFRHALESERRSHLSRISAAESLKKVLEHRAFRGEL